MNTIWLIVAGLVAVIAAGYVFWLLPKLRKKHGEAGAKGALSAFTGPFASAIVGGIAVCLFAVALYLAWAKPGPVAGDMTQNGQLSPEHLAMLKSLSDRLEKNPDDGKGWAMLARSYAVLKRYKEALPAYEKAANLIPNDPVLLVDYADILAAENGRHLQGKPVELLQKALTVDPNNIKGLNLMGTASYQVGNYTHAINYWEKILTLVPEKSRIADQVNKNIAIARNREAQATSKQTPTQARAQTRLQVSGVVKLSPALVGRASPGDTVFVFAKAVSGPPVPVAVLRAQVRDLPKQFVLNDKMAMMPDAKLSNFKTVTLIARVSKTGNASSQSGDLQGEVGNVKVGADNVQLVINKVVP